MPSHDSSFRDDTRAVAPLIGFILLFGIATIAFASYQAYSVPQQNTEAEFDHLQLIDNEWTALHASYLNSFGAETTRFSTITLGAQYPNRVFAVNPPPPIGTINTQNPGTITSPTCGQQSTAQLTYTVQYNELPNDPTWVIEGAVAYREEAGTPIVLSQRLVTDNTLRLFAFQGTPTAYGVQRAVIGTGPGTVTTQTVEDPSAELPTRLTEQEWENRILRDVPDDEITVSNGTLQLNLTGNYTVLCGETTVSGDDGTAPNDQFTLTNVRSSGTNKFVDIQATSPPTELETITIVSSTPNTVEYTIEGQTRELSPGETWTLSPSITVDDTVTLEARPATGGNQDIDIELRLNGGPVRSVTWN